MGKIFGPDTLDWRVIPINWDAIEGDTIPAGTPMDKDGNIANDASCYGVLMDDVQRGRNKKNGGRVVISGCIDVAEAEKHSGVKLSDEAKAAVPDLWSPGGASSWNDLTDKPFYSEIKKIELLPETTTIATDKGGVLRLLIGAAPAPTIGETYEITLDGTTYVLEAGSLDGVAFVGNLSIAGMSDDTGEPFVWADGLFAVNYSADSYTVKIVGNGKEYHCMDSGYIHPFDSSAQDVPGLPMPNDILSDVVCFYYVGETKLSDVVNKRAVFDLIGGDVDVRLMRIKAYPTRINEMDGSSSVSWECIDMTNSSFCTAKFIFGEQTEDAVLTRIDVLYRNSIRLTSPNGTKYNLAVADDGTLSATAAT